MSQPVYIDFPSIDDVGPADRIALQAQGGRHVVLATESRNLLDPEQPGQVVSPLGDQVQFIRVDGPARDRLHGPGVPLPVEVDLYPRQPAYAQRVEGGTDVLQLDHGSLSGGRVGYLHIKAMDPSSLAKFKKELGEFRHKEGMVIDERWNGGGNIEQELLGILLPEEGSALPDHVEQPPDRRQDPAEMLRAPAGALARLSDRPGFRRGCGSAPARRVHLHR